MKVYAVDFDGFLCQSAYPDIGEPHMDMIDYFIQLRADGHKLILWTCREGEKLSEAIVWCAGHGLLFDAHNENLPELTKRFGNDSRKIGADWYCDDRNLMLQPDRGTILSEIKKGIIWQSYGTDKRLEGARE